MSHWTILILTCFLLGFWCSPHLPFSESGQRSQDPLIDDFVAEDDEDNFISNDEWSEGYYCVNCNDTLVKPKKVINPYRELLLSKVPPKPFGNFCAKCAACLAVAQEIQNIIEYEVEECETDPDKRKVVYTNLKSQISKLCLEGFKNFDFRSYRSHGIFTNNHQCTTHIITPTQENWITQLRKLCSLYVSRINLDLIATSVLDFSANLTDTLCRGTGIFRDCLNIKSHGSITMLQCNECYNENSDQ